MAYPEHIPARIPIIHEGSVSSSGKKTTSSGNTEFDFTDTPLNSLEITAHANDIHVKFNAETNTHLVQAGGTICVDGLVVTKFIIVENGVEYSYSGLYYLS